MGMEEKASEDKKIEHRKALELYMSKKY